MHFVSIILAILGLALGTAVVAWFGVAHVFDAAFSVGWAGFGILLAWQALLFIVLGLAWTVIAVPADRWKAAPTFIWGRMVRDSGGNCLPFSPVGGFVLGARAVTLRGIGWPVATGSTVADVTAEVLAQLAFTGIALCILVSREPDTVLAIPLAVGLGVALAGMAAFMVLQRGASTVFAFFGRHVSAQWLDAAQARVDQLQDVLSAIYARPWSLAIGCFIHLLGWLGTGVGDWIALRLLGIDIELSSAIALDGLLHAVLAVAFVVPGAAGVQEAAYAGFGTLFGVEADVAVGLSLLRRARDLAAGVPILVLWQVFEVQRLRRVRAERARSPEAVADV